MKKKINRKYKDVSYDKITNKRFIFFIIFIIFLFSILFIKIYQVMIKSNKIYKEKLSHLTYTKVDGSSTPRGRILDRNLNVIVDNKAVKTITYKKSKKTTNQDMIQHAYNISNHIDLDISLLNDRMKKEFLFNRDYNIFKEKATEKEKESVVMRKITQHELDEIIISRITNEELDKLTDFDKKVAYIFYLMNKGYNYDEKTIKMNATEEEYAYVSENTTKLGGFNTKIDWERVYPYGNVLKSILGSVSTSTTGIPLEKKDKYLKQGYSLNDRVGLSYLEEEYEKYLKGTKEEYEVINSHELKLNKEGKRGNDIVLSIDINLQQEVENILTNEVLRTKNEANTNYYDHSSVILTNPKTGEILAMASKKYKNGEIIDNTISILTEPITPGSVVKGASMLVGYQTGVIRIGEKIKDECIEIYSIPKKCSSVDNLGTINDITALAKSSNVYQFKTALRVNGSGEYRRGMRMFFNQDAFNIYRKMYRSFGLGEKTGIDLPVESKGYTSEDKNAGNLLDYVIGQYETYTPLQLSQYVSTIASGGDRYKLHLLKEVHEATNNNELGKKVYEYENKILNKVEVDSMFMQRVQAGFYAVMNSSGGYGVGYMPKYVRSAGKTGTSQSFIDTNNDGRIDTETITSSFIGYFPYEDPKVSIIVTSPDSSHPNSKIDYASQVTMRITQQVTNKYVSMYGV